MRGDLRACRRWPRPGGPRCAASRGAAQVDYLYDEDGTPYGAVYRSPATSTSPTYFTTITNDRGDICELLDANGNAFAAYHYDAWGLPTATTTQATTLITASLAANMAARQVLRYAGYAYDAESGLYYCSARYYDPVTRQFTTADSAKADGEESAYQYCCGDPVGKVDPTGEGKITPAIRRRIIAEANKEHFWGRHKLCRELITKRMVNDLHTAFVTEAVGSSVAGLFCSKIKSPYSYLVGVVLIGNGLTCADMAHELYEYRGPHGGIWQDLWVNISLTDPKARLVWNGHSAAVTDLDGEQILRVLGYK